MKQILCALILSSSIGLAGCQSTQEISSKPIERVALDISEPAPLSLTPVKFDVITPTNAEEKFKKTQDNTYIAMTPKDYESLAKNIERIQGWVAEHREVLKSYKIYYEKDLTQK